MTPQRPTVTKQLFLWLVVAAAAALVLLIFVMRQAMNHQAAQVDTAAVKNVTVSIDDQNFTLKDGVAEQPAAPGSALQNTVRVIGDPVSGDVNGDGKLDAALLLANNGGGSGTFYYAVLAVNDGGSFHTTNVLPLGDRIKPDSIIFDNGKFVYRFSERKPGEPMAADPRVPKTVTVRLDPASGKIQSVS